MTNQRLTEEQIQLYHQQGYLVVKNFCSIAEIDKLYNTALEDNAMKNNAMDLNDQTGKKTKLSLWFTPGNDVFGYLTRSEKVVHSLQQLLGSRSKICHFHSKLMQNQFMFPDELISVMIALTPANRENGCLQVIKNSHKMGRVNHGFTGEQVGADMEMVNNALKTMDLVYAELDP